MSDNDIKSPTENSKNLNNANEPPIVTLGEDMINTISNPNPFNIIVEIEHILQLIKIIKEKIKNVHPSFLEVIKSLF